MQKSPLSPQNSPFFMPFLVFLLLVSIFLGLSAYSIVVISKNGGGILEAFFTPMLEFTWIGQFNLDFLCFLLLTSLWIFWRHRFSALGAVAGLLVYVGGAQFLSLYLLYQFKKNGGDLRKVLIGQRTGE